MFGDYVDIVKTVILFGVISTLALMCFGAALGGMVAAFVWTAGIDINTPTNVAMTTEELKWIVGGVVACVFIKAVASMWSGKR